MLLYETLEHRSHKTYEIFQNLPLHAKQTVQRKMVVCLREFNFDHNDGRMTESFMTGTCSE